MTIEPYKTVRSETKSEITIKRSVFLSFIAPCTSKSQALEFLARVKALHWDAVHHCYAWRIGSHGLEYRMSDDGEPSGTAGKPILFAMQRADLSDVIVVVARYYGGIKLGVGPLARAYAEIAQSVIEASELVVVRPTARLTVFCIYDDGSVVTRLLEEAEARFTPSYSDVITYEVDVPIANLDVLVHELVSRTNARAGYLKVAAE